MFQIHVNLQKLTQMMEYIIYQKYYSNSEKVPDEVFIQNMRKLIRNANNKDKADRS